MSLETAEMSKHKRAKRSLTKALVQELLSFEDSDAGNAEAFELLHGHRFRYNHTTGKWLVWNGNHWTEDRDGEALRATLDTVRCRQIAAITIDIDERIKWAIGSEANWRRVALLKSAETIQSLTTTAEQYDRDPFLLTVANGTVDLRTGELCPSRPEDLITRATHVSYKEDATAPPGCNFSTKFSLPMPS
jgi:putative DNA primase/helicase